MEREVGAGEGAGAVEGGVAAGGEAAVAEEEVYRHREDREYQGLGADRDPERWRPEAHRGEEEEAGQGCRQAGHACSPKSPRGRTSSTTANAAKTMATARSWR